MGPSLGSGSVVNLLPRIGKTHSEAEPPLFGTVFLPPYRCWRGLLASGLLHCVLLPSLPVLGLLLPETDDEVWRRQALVIRPLEIRVPERVYLPSDVSAGVPAPKREKPAQRRFELPELPRKLASGQTVLQPQFPPDLPLQRQVRLPNVVFWNTAPQLPRPAPKRFIDPGTRTPVVQATTILEAPPRLETPNQELAVSDLKMTGGVILDNPALPRPPATTSPVRVFRPALTSPAPPRGVALDTGPGDPVNLLALSSDPAPREKALWVPAGNQLGRLPGPPVDAGDGPPGETAGHAGTGGDGSSGETTGDGRTGGRGAGGGGVGFGSGRTGNGTGAGSGAGGSSAGQRGTETAALSFPGSALPGAVAARVVHPNNSVYDIIIESSSSGILPDTAGILSGQPIYTVYIRVGPQKDWMLQYCRPEAAERALQRGGVVSLGTPVPIKAPYPLVTLAPPVPLNPRTEPVLLHGFLDVTGRFKALRLVRERDPKLEALLVPYLMQWQFRPGTRDGVPVLLEVLLVIPAGQA